MSNSVVVFILFFLLSQANACDNNSAESVVKSYVEDLQSLNCSDYISKYSHDRFWLAECKKHTVMIANRFYVEFLARTDITSFELMKMKDKVFGVLSYRGPDHQKFTLKLSSLGSCKVNFDFHDNWPLPDPEKPDSEYMCGLKFWTDIEVLEYETRIPISCHNGNWSVVGISTIITR